MNALNPKVSLLQKLAKVTWHAKHEKCLDLEALLQDPEVVEWLGRMAELQYVENFSRATASIGQSAGDRVGYQLCATLGFEDEPYASYSEATSHQEALEKCMKQFPFGNGYVDHSVKVIDTGEIIYPGRAHTLPTTQTAIEDAVPPSTYVADRLPEMIEPESKAKPSGLSLGEPDSPPEPEELGLKL